MEIPIVILIAGLLTGAMFLIIKPSKRLGGARDATRWSDSIEILNAILKYQAEHDGDLPNGIDDEPATGQVLGTKSSGCDSGCAAIKTVSACLDLSDDLIDGYISAVPIEPGKGNKEFTGYYLNRDNRGRITIGACNPEQDEEINITR